MVQVQDISPLMVCGGGTVRLSGSGFDVDCSVMVDDEYVSILDYGPNWLEFSAPSALGQLTVKLIRDGVEEYQTNIFVVKLGDTETWNLPVRGEEEFRDAQIGLMPRGFAWYTGKTGNWWKLFSAFASGFLEIYNSFRNLVSESCPAKTTSFAEWEKELGLPIKGAVRSTDEGRLAEVYRVARKCGGATIPYFKSVALLFEKVVNIYEYFKNPEKFEDVDFGDDDPNFYWMIELEANSSDMHVCTCNDTCNDYLREWWDVPLEAMFDSIKPAHTKLVYVYTNDFQELVLVDNNENIVMAMPANRPIAVAVRSGEIVNTGTAVVEGHEVQTIRIKDLPAAQDDTGFFVRDSEAGGTVKANAMDQATLDELWDTTEPEPSPNDNNG